MNTAVRNTNTNVTAVTTTSIKASEWTPAHSLAMVSGQAMPVDTASVNRRFIMTEAPTTRGVHSKPGEAFTVPEGHKVVVMSGKPLSLEAEGSWHRIRMV